MENTKYRTAFITEVNLKDFNDREHKNYRTVPFVASTNAVDRHGTRVNQDNWRLENFKNNPIIGYQHNVYGTGLCEKATPDDIIGKGMNIRVEDGKLLVDIRFKDEGVSELADKVAYDVANGYLNAVSVGFLPVGKGKMVEEEGREVYHFDGQELLEISVVNIPSNAEALKKSLRGQTARGIMWAKRAMGDEYSFSDIEKMTVRELIDAIEGKKYDVKVIESKVEGGQSSDSEAYEHAKLMERLQVKQKQVKIKSNI